MYLYFIYISIYIYIYTRKQQKLKKDFIYSGFALDIDPAFLRRNSWPEFLRRNSCVMCLCVCVYVCAGTLSTPNLILGSLRDISVVTVIRTLTH